MSRRPRTPSVREALALGLLHGPAELLPISSSGHVALVPWLARWDHAELDAELRKAFEVALHAGTAAALVVAAGGVTSPPLGVLAGSLAPPALAGYALERPIERHLGTPATIAAGLVAGSVAMVLADRRASRRRRRAEAGWRDGLALGLAQAAALVPGVSRSGATLAAARARGFDRRAAGALSYDVAVPVIAGAAVLKGARLARRGLPPGAGAAFAVGAAASFASTLACARAVRRDRPLAPYAAYRVALAAVVLRRLWQDRQR